MKPEILEELSKGNWGSGPRRLVLDRVVKFIAVCLILILLFWLILIEDYTSLFFLLGAMSGFLVFMISRFLQNNFGKERPKQGPADSPEVRKRASSAEARRKSAVGDRD